jgi:SAM-dependent methyltransferase
MTPVDPDSPWYDRFFGPEYLAFDEHADTALQVDFIREVLDLTRESTLLDVGCGYGRHSIPLSRTKKGCRVVALDRSPVMLAAAREAVPASRKRKPHWVRADMRALPLLRGVDAAVSMFSSLGYFESEDENFSVIRGVAEALVPGGRFLIETVNRDFVVRHLTPVQVYRPRDLVVIEERSFDPVSSRSRVDVTVIDSGRETRLYHSVRLYTFTEIEMLLSAAGLATEAVCGDFRGASYTCDSPRMIVVAEKP